MKDFFVDNQGHFVGDVPTICYNQSISWRIHLEKEIDALAEYTLAIDTDTIFSESEICALVNPTAIDTETRTLVFEFVANSRKLALKTDGKLCPFSGFFQISHKKGEGSVFDCLSIVYFLPCVYAEDGGSEVISVEKPIASKTNLGCVKIGDNISVSADGTISATGSQYTLPTATSVRLGGVKINATYGITIFGDNSDGLKGIIAVSKAEQTDIANRSGMYKPIVSANLNYAVTAALTDTNHITLTNEQKATAQDVIGAQQAALHGSGAPTTSIVGKVGQGYVDDDTQETYTCTAVTNTGTEAEPVYSYAWTNDINAMGGQISSNWSIKHPYLTVSPSIISTITNVNGILFLLGGASGGNNRQQAYVTEITAFDRISLQARSNKITWNSHLQNTAGGISIIGPDGVQYTPHGYSAGITTIPSAALAYTLSEGYFTHIPDTAPTYTLPTPTDTTRTKEIVLNVRFSATALSYAFEDAVGNTITPLSTPTIADGTVVSFLCRYEPLLSQWTIMPVMLGTYTAPAE